MGSYTYASIVIGAAAAVGAGIFLASLPDIFRYLRIRCM